MSTKINEIYKAVLPEMEANDIEDTPENRLSFLQGLVEAWLEDPDRSSEKMAYVLAVELEIRRLAGVVRNQK